MFETQYPDFIIKTWSIFRNTGRFIWISNYLILTLALVYIIKHFTKKATLITLLCCLCLQIYDFTPSEQNKSGFLYNYRLNLKSKSQPSSLYNNNAWNILFEDNNIKYIYFDKSIYNYNKYNFPDASNKLMMLIADYVKDKNIKLNSFYFARPIKIDKLDEVYYKELKNPKDEDIFIFLRENYINTEILPKTLKYYYVVKDLIIGRTKEIKE